MTATLSQTQSDLSRLVDLASRGEDVVITVGGQAKAKITRADSSITAEEKPVNLNAWLLELAELRQKYSTGKSGLTVEQILDEDRSDRI